MTQEPSREEQRLARREQAKEMFWQCQQLEFLESVAKIEVESRTNFGDASGRRLDPSYMALGGPAQKIVTELDQYLAQRMSKVAMAWIKRKKKELSDSPWGEL